MEEEEGEGEALSTPFWVQRTADRRRRASAVFFSSGGLVILLLLVTAVSFSVFVLPKTLSLSAQIFRPNSVKKSWDSLNLVLVLAAIVLAFISRNEINNEDGSSPSPSPSSSAYYNEFQDSPMKQAHVYKASQRSQNSDLSTSKVWDGTYSEYNVRMEHQSSSMRRNISSYPDLRGFTPIDWYSNEEMERRYYDDTYMGRVMDQAKIHRRHRSLGQVDDPRTVSHGKTVVIEALLSKYDTDVKLPAPDRLSPPVPPPSQPPEKERQVKSSRKVKREVEPVEILAPPSTEEKAEGSDGGRKRGGATKDILNSLYHKNVTKKQRQRSVDVPQSPPSSSPALKNIFSLKKHKRKKTITVSLKSSSAAREAKLITTLSSRKAKSAPKSQISSSDASHKLTPPKQKMMSLFDNLDEISNSGGESPLSRIPPAPPPPPPGFLKNPTWRFVVRGDYVRVNSSASSRSESPEIDDVESDFAGDQATPSFSGDSLLFYPSPDVDTKAESFISSFRAKLRLEKMHSVKNREVGLSSLGPRVGPTNI